MILAFIVSFIIIFLKPFGAGSNDFPFKNIYFLGFGFLVFLAYLISFFLSRLYYRKTNKWKWAEEIIFILFFISLSISIANIYTELVINKNPSRINLQFFVNWFKVMFLGFGIIIAVITLLLRKHFAIVTHNAISLNFDKSSFEYKTRLTGSLKRESIDIELSKIVYIKSEDNYINIYYFENNILVNKMLRSTLKAIHHQLKGFIKTHRSYLINPIHINELKGNSQNAYLVLESIEKTIPVSKTFYKKLIKYHN
jgi:hypothetical protein